MNPAKAHAHGPWDGTWSSVVEWDCHVHRLKHSLHRDPLAGPWMEEPKCV